MKQPDDRNRLRHMLDHSREAVDMTEGKRREDLKSDRILELALVRLIEIVGEAAVKMNPEGQAECPLIPWREVIGMRNRLIHGYDSVDLDVLWDTIENDLPPLIKELERILGNKENGNTP